MFLRKKETLVFFRFGQPLRGLALTSRLGQTRKNLILKTRYPAILLTLTAIAIVVYFSQTKT